jgi:hypothetical protein
MKNKVRMGMINDKITDAAAFEFHMKVHPPSDAWSSEILVSPADIDFDGQYDPKPLLLSPPSLYLPKKKSCSF